MIDYLEFYHEPFNIPFQLYDEIVQLEPEDDEEYLSWLKELNELLMV